MTDTWGMPVERGHVTVETRTRPAFKPFLVTGYTPKGEETSFVVDGTDPADAIWRAKKKCALNSMRAEPVS